MEEKTNNNAFEKELSLKGLINITEWSKIQDRLSSIADMCIRTLDINGNPVAPPSAEPKICKLIKEPPLKRESCGAGCLPTFMGGQAVIDKNLSFSCKAGLHQFLVPLRLPNGNVICYIIFGPVILVMRKSMEEYCDVAEDLNIGLEQFWDALLEIRVISFNRIQNIVELIKEVGEYILKLAYEHITFEEEIKEIMGAASPELNSLFDVFLDVAIQVSGADIGSIMLLDNNARELTIRSSHGLPEEITKGSRVRLGEGISGLAAKDEKALLISPVPIPDDKRLKRQLTRPYIASSMVIPIKLKDRLLGVINLAALQSSSVRFNEENVKTINKLTELTTLAIQTPLSK